MNTEPTPIARQLADGTPERLGRYRLVRPISTGGMARVFEARRESLAGVTPRVAIKVILPDFADNRPFQELFVHEARIGSMLQHQNVVQIQDFDCQDGLYYLVMEYVEGLTLRRMASLCRRHGVPVPLDVIAEIGRQVCDGLAHAHTARDEDGTSLNLVHRDIKPSNLMVNPQAVVKLLDFGISKGWSRPELKGAVRGTWGYMSPEQAEGESATLSADLFGLATVLYELATVQPLFPEKEPDVLKDFLSKDEAARRAARMPREYAALARVLVRALQRDPMARFDSAQSMGRALVSLMQDPVSARDRLSHFQEQMTVLDKAPKRLPSAPAPPPVEEMDPASLTTDAGAPGLALSFGDVERPVRPVRRVDKGVVQRPPFDWGNWVLPVFVVVAIAILGFTFDRLWSEGQGVAEPEEVMAAADVVSSAGPTPVVVKRPTPQVAPEPEPIVAVVVEPTVEAQPASPIDPDGEGRVTISSLPKAKVYIDGDFVRSTPLFRYTIPAGARDIELRTADGRSHQFRLNVRDGADINRVWSFEEARFVGN
jgi:serine/threonine protein kinase